MRVPDLNVIVARVEVAHHDTDLLEGPFRSFGRPALHGDPVIDPHVRHFLILQCHRAQPEQIAGLGADDGSLAPQVPVATVFAFGKLRQSLQPEVLVLMIDELEPPQERRRGCVAHVGAPEPGVKVCFQQRDDLAGSRGPGAASVLRHETRLAVLPGDAIGRLQQRDDASFIPIGINDHVVHLRQRGHPGIDPGVIRRVVGRDQMTELVDVPEVLADLTMPRGLDGVLEEIVAVPDQVQFAPQLESHDPGGVTPSRHDVPESLLIETDGIAVAEVVLGGFHGAAVRGVIGVVLPLWVAPRASFAVIVEDQVEVDVMLLREFEHVVQLPCIFEIVPRQAVVAPPLGGPLDGQPPARHPDLGEILAIVVHLLQQRIVGVGAPVRRKLVPPEDDRPPAFIKRRADVVPNRVVEIPVVELKVFRVGFADPDKAPSLRGNGREALPARGDPLLTGSDKEVIGMLSRFQRRKPHLPAGRADRGQCLLPLDLDLL